MLPRLLLTRSIRSYCSQGNPSFVDCISNPHLKYQIWISRSRDPFLNLSIEHHLLQKSHKDSTILFLYINSPCVVIGRNQNPWLEADLRVVGQRARDVNRNEGVIQLVRRRSGGGTVFHDENNLNYSVICPTADFARDKHAEMVARAMRRFNPRARVNERHDIVLDQGNGGEGERRPDAGDMHQTAYSSADVTPKKVSGSAFKLTKFRSLHHGTCLLKSDLKLMGKCLRSKARPFLKARGVDSVRSPVGNLLGRPGEGDMNDFIDEVIKQFRSIYQFEDDGVDNTLPVSQVLNNRDCYINGNHVLGSVGDELYPEVHTGVEEIKSFDWTYRQTPQYILSSHAVDEGTRSRPPLPVGWPSSARVYLKVRSGVITSCEISGLADHENPRIYEGMSKDLLVGKAVHEITDFNEVLDLQPDLKVVNDWLNRMFGLFER